MPPGFNWFLILVVVVVAILVLLSMIYVLIHYSHPEDRNQAWVPKIIIVFGMSLAVFAILMYPTDVANTAACSSSLSPSACTFTLPMKTMWLVLFIAILVMSFAVIPFTLFFYEADSDFTLFQKIKSAAIWTILMLFVIGLIIGICYGLWGEVVWSVQLLSSGTAPITMLANLTTEPGYPCILLPATIPSTALWPPAPPPLGTPDAPSPPHPPSPPLPPVGNKQTLQCIANLPNGNDIVIAKYTQRVSLVIYIIAIQSLLGWILFLIFAGVGVFAAPIDWIHEFIGRPRKTITKSEYMRRGRIIAQRAKEMVNIAAMLRRQERDRKWRQNYKRLEREVVQLEEDEYQLERIYPQGEDGEVRWILFVLGFYLTGFMGIVGLCLSTAWIIHIGLYMLPITGPVSPFLNLAFIALDKTFVLLGVAAFGAFCLYLMVVAMKGNFMLGLNFVFVKLYPMRPGATMVSSLLVNTAIILTMTPAVLQFCAQAFAVYAVNTDISDIFGVQVGYLKGISWIYTNNIFLYMFLVVVFLSAIFMAFKGPKMWQRKKPLDVYLED